MAPIFTCQKGAIMASVLRALQAPAAVVLKRSTGLAGASTRALSTFARAHQTNPFRFVPCPLRTCTLLLAEERTLLNSEDTAKL